jgi:hypothetical protein
MSTCFSSSKLQPAGWTCARAHTHTHTHTYTRERLKKQFNFTGSFGVNNLEGEMYTEP